MEKEFVPYKLALALKELGFDEPCWAWWHIEDCDTRYCYSEQISPIQNSRETEIIGLPLYQQAFRWFRKNYNLYFSPRRYDETKWWIEWGTWTSPVYETYEEAELHCLKKLIEIVKNQK